MIDTHCHLDLFELEQPIEQVIAALAQSGVDLAIMPGISPEHSKQLLDKHQLEHFALGLHPWYIDNDHPAQLKRIAQLMEMYQPIAIGETGVDKVNGPDIKIQIECLHWHCQFAQQRQLPLIVHCVKALPELLQVLKQYQLGFVVHGFYGNVQQAQQVVDAGGYLGIGPALLRDNSKLVEVIALLGVENVLLETDAPFKHQRYGTGIQQIQRALDLVLLEISRILNQSPADLKTQLNVNASMFFRL
ncbi:TatD family hydrolase [Paraferrimonas sp. SM1919]|uniref:TatD family hydrolase n=1 Tax=Paraferrimonas sp. SM1919 TaxID=2662263 RepID=UPI0013D75A08|nr:TatD family hydrolase [Paraferrimonas sp. SM1919]